MLNRKAFQSQSGQVAVVVFLIMAVMLVVGLSLASRTSQEIELAGQQEDTTRVFNAAETGIEEALSVESNFAESAVTDIPITGLDSTNTTGSYSVTPESGFENQFQSGETATVFTNKTSAQAVNISWTATSEANCSSVLIVSVYSEPTTNNFEVQHYGIRPVGCGGFSSTNFSESNDTTPSSGYKYEHQFTASANTVMLRIKPLYGATTIKVSSSILASQLYTVRSQAQDTSTGTTQSEVRAIQVTRTKPAPPAILDYALYSGDTLSK